MWNCKIILEKLKVTYERTTIVKEARISSLVNEFDLFKMVKDESVESMFSRFSKNFCELKEVEMVYWNALQVSALVRSLPKSWETKIVILEDGDLQKMTYDEFWGKLMADEWNHIDRYKKDD